MFLDTKYGLAAEHSSQGGYGLALGSCHDILEVTQETSGNGPQLTAHSELNRRKSWAGYVRYPQMPPVTSLCRPLTARSCPTVERDLELGRKLP